MPKIVTRPEDRRITISIKQGYLIEAGKVGATDLEGYIDWLKSAIAVLKNESIELKAHLYTQNEDKKVAELLEAKP